MAAGGCGAESTGTCWTGTWTSWTGTCWAGTAGGAGVGTPKVAGSNWPNISS